MAYVLTDRTFGITSDTTDANGVRFVTMQVTETYTNNVAPFDSYQFVPPTFTVNNPNHNTVLCVFTETTNPYRTSGSAWPNPFTVRSTSLGTATFNASVLSGSPDITLTVTSTGSYDYDAAPEEVYEEEFTQLDELPYVELADKDTPTGTAHLNEGLN